ncbi:MAG: sulfate ABC transporter substrate-binding protein [Limisphaerales bacterium]
MKSILPTYRFVGILFGLVIASIAIELQTQTRAETGALLNVSYDVTREFYQDINKAFVAQWKQTHGEAVTINQSHGGSSKQARSVLDGLEADVVTMNQPLDIDVLAQKGKLIPDNWATRLPNNSVPYTSTILFLVRKGNPKQIKDWDDLVRPGVGVVIPNPKTSGNGRYSYLAAWGYALKRNNGDTNKARAFTAKLFGNVPVLDNGGRGATTTFAQREVGDVLLTFENEAILAAQEFGKEKFEMIVPSISIKAENPVAWVDRYTKKHNSQALAKAYMEFLYSDAGQEIAAQHFFRPATGEILKKHGDRFPSIETFTVEEVFGGWSEAHKTHFAEGTHVAKLIELYSPNAIALEECVTNPRRVGRIQTLVTEIEERAEALGIRIERFSRKQICHELLDNESATKLDLAQNLATRYPEQLGFRMPKKRRFGDGEAYQVDIFDAVALAQCCRKRVESPLKRKRGNKVPKRSII